MSAPESTFTDDALRGRRIVLTRPETQNVALAARIRALGGEPVLFPALAIGEITGADAAALDEALTRLAACDLAVFASPNAVARVLPRVQAQGGWPPALATATVGPATAAALRRHGVARVIAPEGRFDSEHLLALLPADMRDQRVCVFRGQDGRPLLGETLRARGAQVEYVTCYVRTCPSVDAQRLAALRTPFDAVVVTSSEGLRNLWTMLDDAARKMLVAGAVFVPHARIAEAARALGLPSIVVTAPGDAGVLSALGRFWAKVQGT